MHSSSSSTCHGGIHGKIYSQGEKVIYMCQITFADTNQKYMNVICQNSNKGLASSENRTLQNYLGLQSVVDTLDTLLLSTDSHRQDMYQKSWFVK